MAKGLSTTQCIPKTLLHTFILPTKDLVMRIVVAALLAGFATGLDGQTPGTRLTVDVNVVSVTLRGDTARVTYVLYNRPASQDSLVMFTVEAPAHVTFISIPEPDSLWSADTMLYS